MPIIFCAKVLTKNADKTFNMGGDMKNLLTEMADRIERLQPSSSLIHEKNNVICMLRMAARTESEDMYQRAYDRGMRLVEQSVSKRRKQCGS